MKNLRASHKKFAPVILMTVLLWAGAGSTQAEEQIWTDKHHAASDIHNGIKLSLFSDLVERFSPAVVNIRALEKVPIRPYRDYPWGQSPGDPLPRAEDSFQRRGEGSGFIIHRDGYILTNEHVVAGSDAIQVGLKDGKLYRGKVVGLDKAMDIGLIKIDAPGPLPVLPLGRSDELKIGEWVMAIGSPYGLEQTVTVGIVSGKGRSLGTSPFDDFIQIDAPINPGNSGGPLINTSGEVVGINTMILERGQGLGFSLPIDLVKIVLPQLKEEGRVIRSWLGVVIQEITIDIQEKLKLPAAHGAYVIQVVADGPAAHAGVQEGDVVIRFDGKDVKNSRQLPLLCAHTPSGKPIAVGLIRDGKEIEITVTLQKTTPPSAR